MKSNYVLATLCLSLIVSFDSLAEMELEDGDYSARVRTDSGTYRVPVEVRDGEIDSIRWPNGGRMKLRGAEVDEDGEAIGRNYDGDRFRIELDE